MTETITTNENQPKEEKIKRLIQRKIDEYEKRYWELCSGAHYLKAAETSERQGELKELLKEIETL